MFTAGKWCACANYYPLHLAKGFISGSYPNSTSAFTLFIDRRGGKSQSHTPLLSNTDALGKVMTFPTLFDKLTCKNTQTQETIYISPQQLEVYLHCCNGKVEAVFLTIPELICDQTQIKYGFIIGLKVAEVKAYLDQQYQANPAAYTWVNPANAKETLSPVAAKM